MMVRQQLFRQAQRAAHTDRTALVITLWPVGEVLNAN